MPTTLLNVLLRAALLVALTASTALYVDYSQAAPAFCGVQSGCAAVRDSAFSSIGGISLPAIGMGVFAGLLAMALWASSARHHRLLALQTGVVALGAVALIGVQLFVVEATCGYCMAVDVAAIAAFFCAALLARREPEPQLLAARFVWAAVGVVAVAAPLLWEHEPPTASVPPGVAQHYRDGKVNIVTFTDFECPFCRLMHPAIDDVVHAHAGRVNLVRLMMPLRGHPGAEPAALAYLCTPDAYKDRMADALYGAEAGTLDPKTVVGIAKEMGLDHQALAACMESEDTRARLEADKQLFAAAELRGLPSTFVNDQLVAGADEPALLSAVDDALGSGGGGMGVGWMFALLAVLALAAAGISLKVAAVAEEVDGAEA